MHCRCHSPADPPVETSRWPTNIPLPWEVVPAGRGHHERGTVQGNSVELDVGIVRISQRSELANIALDGVIRSAGLDNDIRGTILYRSLQFLGFPDDIDIIGRTTGAQLDSSAKRQDLD